MRHSVGRPCVQRLNSRTGRERAQCTGRCLLVYTQRGNPNERASYNGSIEASQASDVGSIPIARSINPDDSKTLRG
jgi:hypothetical protein